MTFPAHAILTAIAHRVERAGLPGRFTFDRLAGLGDEQARARAKCGAPHVFDVVPLQYRDNAATAVGSAGDQRIIDLAFEINVWSHAECLDDTTQRTEFIAEVMSDCDDVIQAIANPDALTLSPQGEATDIASGLALSFEAQASPTWERVAEDWNNHLVQSRISASVIVTVLYGQQ